MKNMMNWLLSGALFAGIAGLGMAGCGETKEAYNCAEICETYSDCASKLNIDVDVTECVTSCENKADKDEEFKQDAEACQECLSPADSCKDSLPCASECAGVVPEVL
ncbi:MAG TPA: hypothetical protein VNM90_31075 [Haliangium sp.]|nr:hypothetical protein [Haliangium sp.]